MHDLPGELDPFVDCCCGHPSGFELFVKHFRMPRSDLVDRRSNSQAEIVTAMYVFSDA